MIRPYPKKIAWLVGLAVVLQAQAPTGCGPEAPATDVVVGASADVAASGAQSEIAGKYTLVAVDDRRLPVRFSGEDDDCQKEIVRGSLTIRGDGSFTRSLTERETCEDESPEEETETENGKVSRSGNSLTFDNDSEGTAQVMGNVVVWTTNDYSRKLRLRFQR